MLRATCHLGRHGTWASPLAASNQSQLHERLVHGERWGASPAAFEVGLRRVKP